MQPGSRIGVIAALDKARPSLPIKPLPKKELSDDNLQKSGAKGAKIVKAVKSVKLIIIDLKLNLCELTLVFSLKI